MKTIARALFVVTVVGASLSVTPALAADPPTAEAQKEASECFVRGVDLFRENDFRAALIEFRRAYDLTPNYRVLFNIGQTALGLQDYAQSLDAFEQYLAQGGAEVPADRRVQVEAEVKRLRSRVANVTVKVNVPDAAIAVDDIIVGTSPLAHPIRVSAGRHKISASTPDTVPETRAVELIGGESTTLSLELVAPTRTVQLQPQPGSARSAEDQPSRTPFWVGVAVTGALAVGTAVTGLVVLSNKSTYDDEIARYRPEGNIDRIDSARSSAKTSAVVFDILAAATIVAGGVTLVMGLSGPSTAKSAKARWVSPSFGTLLSSVPLAAVTRALLTAVSG